MSWGGSEMHTGSPQYKSESWYGLSKRERFSDQIILCHKMMFSQFCFTNPLPDYQCQCKFICCFLPSSNPLGPEKHLSYLAPHMARKMVVLPLGDCLTVTAVFILYHVCYQKVVFPKLSNIILLTTYNKFVNNGILILERVQ